MHPTPPLDADDVAVKGSAHILKVTEDKCLVDVKATRDDVLGVLGRGGGGIQSDYRTHPSIGQLISSSSSKGVQE